tara:strand:+ start:903 stop:1076 length:174 start_codon:yes stop_codon:yes gene_type:complete
MNWFNILKKTGKNKGSGLSNISNYGRGYKAPKESTSRRKEEKKDILEPEIQALEEEE